VLPRDRTELFGFTNQRFTIKLETPYWIVGWMTRLELATFWTTIRRSNQLNYNHHIKTKRLDSIERIKPLKHICRNAFKYSIPVQLFFVRVVVTMSYVYLNVTLGSCLNCFVNVYIMNVLQFCFKLKNIFGGQNENRTHIITVLQTVACTSISYLTICSVYKRTWFINTEQH